MKLETFSYAGRADGWSVDALPPLDSERTLVVVFGSPGYRDNPAPIEELARHYPSSTIIGCSTAGEILDTAVFDEALAVALLAFEDTAIMQASCEVPSPADSREVGREIARTLLRPDLRSVLVFSDGLCVNGSELVRGLNEILPPSTVVTGGLAGDGERFEQTWVLRDGRPRPRMVTGVGFYGDRVRIGHGSKGGWDIFGPERRVTRSRGNVLYELDGKPALDLYRQYLGELASGLPATALLFPLALRSDTADEKQIVRTILSVDESEKSMTFAGDLPQGCLAQLMKANLDRLIDGASEAAVMTRASEGVRDDIPVLAIAISCVGRRLILGERAEDELEATADALPEQTRQIGFYSYGEISPYANGLCDLHNQTMTLTTICET